MSGIEQQRYTWIAILLADLVWCFLSNSTEISIGSLDQICLKDSDSIVRISRRSSLELCKMSTGYVIVEIRFKYLDNKQFKTKTRTRISIKEKYLCWQWEKNAEAQTCTGDFFSLAYSSDDKLISNLLVPWTENHLSSFKCSFLNIFSRQNMLRSLSRRLFLLRWNKYGAKKTSEKPHSIRLLRWFNFSQSGSRKSNRKTLKELLWNQLFKWIMSSSFLIFGLLHTPIQQVYTFFQNLHRRINDYTKDGGPGVVWPSCSFHHDPLRH